MREYAPLLQAPPENGACSSASPAVFEGEMRIAALTGSGPRSDVQRALAAGFDHHLVKPINCENLIAVLEGDRP